MIEDIADEYLAAGADVVETNTFSGTSIAQGDYGLESVVHELNVEAARIARRAAARWTARTPERPRYVAGAIGPTNRTLSISPDVNDQTFRASTFDALRDAYAEQARGLIEGGCDLLLIETIFDTLNAKAAISAVRQVFDEQGSELPLMLSVTITDRSGRTPVGPDHRRVSGCRWPTPGLSRSASTARSAPATCGRTWRSWPASPTPG